MRGETIALIREIMYPGFCLSFGLWCTKLDDFRSIFDDASDHPFLLDQLKQLGFYTDCLGQAHWAIPANSIDEKLAKDVCSNRTGIES